MICADELLPYSNKKARCVCDSCGNETYIVKYSLTRRGGSYTTCPSCRKKKPKYSHLIHQNYPTIEDKLRAFLSVGLKSRKRLVRQNSDLLQWLNDNYPNLPLEEQFFLFNKGLSEAPTCLSCGGRVRFVCEKIGYRQTCSHRCLNVHWAVSGKREEHKKKAVTTNREKYGVDFPCQTRSVIDKIAAAKWGSEYVVKSNFTPDTLDMLNDNKALSDILDRMSIKEAEDYLQIHNATIYKYARKHGITDGYGNSLSEKSIGEWLQELNVEFKKDRKVLSGKEIDFYSESAKFGIEVNELTSHTEIFGKKDRNYHLNKLIRCEDKGIRLIHIFDDEWFNRRRAVQTIIKTQLKLQKVGRGARLLHISSVGKREAHSFFERYHVQGTSHFSQCLGAFDDTVLVAVIGFGPLTRQSSYDVELKRFCTDGAVYPGVFSKLCTHYVSAHHPKTIVSFCDKRYFTGKSYERIGFVLDGEIKPDYYYVENFKLRHNKSKFRLASIRKKFGVSGVSEWEAMQKLKFDRIWDCGKKRFVWTA